MPTTRYPVTDVIVETPRYGTGGGGFGSTHDVIGHGWVEIDGHHIKIAVHPEGLVGELEPKEKCTYALSDITSWHATGEEISFGVGEITVFSTNGAQAPVHIAQWKCRDADAARRLTEAARLGGLVLGTDKPFHSGI